MNVNLQMLALLIALPLAFIAGVALQRGGICAVLATRDLIERRDARRFVAFLECVAWSLGVLLLANILGLMSLSAWPDYRPGIAALAGGAVFGVGATLNDACAFGTIGRLCTGEVSFLAVVPGLFLGALVPADWLPLSDSAMFGSPLALATGLLIAGILAALFVTWRGVTLFRAPAWHPLRAADWHPAFAMAIIGIVNVSLIVLVSRWPYTALITDAVTGGGSMWGMRLLLVGAFIAGGVGSSISARRFRFRRPTTRALLQRMLAGLLMGLGAGMIPGGNDSLLLLGLPLLLPFALAAYAAMMGGIALVIIVGDRLRVRRPA